jgi:hypothetical protein
VPGSSPLVPSQPGTPQGTIPGVFTAPMTQTATTSTGCFRARRSRYSAHQPHHRRRVRNSRPSSAWWRGIPRIQMLSYASLAMTCLRVSQPHLHRSPMCLSVPITSLGQGIISISSCGEACRRVTSLKSTVMAPWRFPRLGVVQVWGLTLDQVQRLCNSVSVSFMPTFVWRSPWANCGLFWSTW